MAKDVQARQEPADDRSRSEKLRHAHAARRKAAARANGGTRFNAIAEFDRMVG
jgi:hypothetical protein